MRTIFGVDDIVLVDEDGSPCGQKVQSVPRLVHDDRLG